MNEREPQFFVDPPPPKQPPTPPERPTTRRLYVAFAVSLAVVVAGVAMGIVIVRTGLGTVTYESRGFRTTEITWFVFLIPLFFIHLPINFFKHWRIDLEYLKVQALGCFIAYVAGIFFTFVIFILIMLILALLKLVGFIESVSNSSLIFIVVGGIVHLSTQIAFYWFVPEE